VKNFRLTGLLAAALLLLARAAGFAREQGGGHGGRGFRGGHGYTGGRGFEGSGYDWDPSHRGYYHGAGPSFYLRYGAPYYYRPYTYAPGACGYDDAYGYGHAIPDATRPIRTGPIDVLLWEPVNVK
jgi:hypothetical protein